MNMESLKAIPLSYGIGFNDLVNDKLKKVVEIKQGLNSLDIDFSIIEKIKDCDCNELKNIVEVISSTIDDVSLKRFMSQVSIVNSIINVINTKKCYDDDMCNKINLLIDKMESAYTKFSNEDKTNESQSNIVSQCIANLKTITYKCRNIDEKADMINLDNIGKMKTKDLNESLEFKLSNPLTNELTLYHGSTEKFNIIKPMSINAGTRISNPRQSSFWTSDFNGAVLFAAEGVINKYRKLNNLEKITHVFDLKNMKMLIDRSRKNDVINILKRNPIYVYEKTMPSKYIGRGHNIGLHEYTLDIPVRPDKIHVLYYDDIKNIEFIDVRIINDILTKHMSGKYDMYTASLMDRLLYHSPEKAISIRKEIKQFFNESIVLSTTSEKIYSQDNPNGTNVVGRNNFKKNPNDLLNYIMTADSDEQFINRLSNIDKYLDLYKLDIDDDDLDKIEDLIKYSYDRLIDNNTGLDKLKSVLVDAINDVKVIRVNDFQSSDAVSNFIDFAEKYIDKIKNRIYSNENDGVDYKTDAMTEFGFGFMYEYHNDMTPDEIDSFVKDLNETVDNEISMDIMEVLNEADEYKKQERKEQRKRNIQTLKFKGKELKLTNVTARNAMYSLKKLVAVALATASVAAFPNIVTLTAALSVIVMFAKTPYSKDTERQWLYVQLKHELEKIDDKISEMSAAGDEKNKRRLIKMKAKMEMAYEKLKFMAETGGFLK